MRLVEEHEVRVPTLSLGTDFVGGKPLRPFADIRYARNNTNLAKHVVIGQGRFDAQQAHPGPRNAHLAA